MCIKFPNQDYAHIDPRQQPFQTFPGDNHTQISGLPSPSSRFQQQAVPVTGYVGEFWLRRGAGWSIHRTPHQDYYIHLIQYHDKLNVLLSHDNVSEGVTKCMIFILDGKGSIKLTIIVSFSLNLEPCPYMIKINRWQYVSYHDDTLPLGVCTTIFKVLNGETVWIYCGESRRRLHFSQMHPGRES